MPTITLIEHGGEIHTIEAETGQSLMQAAVSNMIEGIVAQCGGNCSCATCHVYVDPDWIDRLTPAGRDERDLIECVSQPQENSRLSCQIPVTDELDGLIVRLPESQI